MNCKKAKEIKLPAVLKKIGAREKKNTDREIWYLSPFRNEKKASFKVNLNKNTWYDFGEGKGGNILEFAMLYFQTDLSGALKELSKYSFSFHQQENIEKSEIKDYKIVSSGKILKPVLINYLHQRKVDISIARKYCKELHYYVNTPKVNYNRAQKLKDKNCKPYDTVKTFFDNDYSGKRATELIQKNCKKRFLNESLKFEKHNDVNDYLTAYRE